MPALSQIEDDELIRRWKRGDSHKTLAKDFGVTTSTARKKTAGIKRDSESIVQSEGKIQSYRENLQWAMDAVGNFMRTEIEPKTCPNDAAWFLYQQAKSEPKDFMSKIASMESKIDQSEEEKTAHLGSRKTLAEIEAFLEGLDDGEEKS
jgi:hypothetical protein